ncbi:MAG: DUF87 domain-containing protein [Clostridia bacterium]
MHHDPSFIGTVQDVVGATIRVALTNETITGISFISGEYYRIGQIGSFVKIPIGYVELYGLVSQIGAGAAPINEQSTSPFGNRWIQVQLIGEKICDGHFQRGLSQYPTIDDNVHIVTEKDLRAIYGPDDPMDYVSIGRLASASSIPSYIDINKLVTRHSAVVGSTGCGKSTTVSSLLNSLSNKSKYPSARILIIDIHGEYSKAIGDNANIFKIGANQNNNEHELLIPFWALSFEEVIKFIFGDIDNSKFATISNFIMTLKKESLLNQPIKEITPESVTVDTPIPFCLHKFWYELYKKEFMTVVPKPGTSSDEVDLAYAVDDSGTPIEGDAMNIIKPVFKTVKNSGPVNERVNWGKDSIGIRQQVEALGNKLKDPRYNFICNPGAWKPNIKGIVEKNLDSLIQNWIGNTKPTTILDLSGIPSVILNDIVGATLRILYDAIFWGRNLPEGGRERPLLLVLEEAHTYLSNPNTNASLAVKRIAKEGRKYGVGMMVVSQRPSEIDSTILSQCGTIIAMRLTNNKDRGYITETASDNLKGLFDMLPILRTGEAIITGEAVSIPIRTIITPPDLNRKPDSADPKVVTKYFEDGSFDGLGGWNQDHAPSNYEQMIQNWRRQSPIQSKEILMNNWTDTPQSSNVARFNYDNQSQTLTVEFKNGGMYNYFDVPEHIYDGLKNAASVGKYLNSHVKRSYRYSRL